MSDPTRDVDILAIGEINPDIVVSDPDPVPVFDEVERIVESVHMTVGSSSAIFACGAARLGLRVAYYGVVGDDAFGRFMLEAMRARGIDVSACLVDPALERDRRSSSRAAGTARSSPRWARSGRWMSMPSRGR